MEFTCDELLFQTSQHSYDLQFNYFFSTLPTFIIIEWKYPKVKQINFTNYDIGKGPE